MYPTNVLMHRGQVCMPPCTDRFVAPAAGSNAMAIHRTLGAVPYTSIWGSAQASGNQIQAVHPNSNSLPTTQPIRLTWPAGCCWSARSDPMSITPTARQQASATSPQGILGSKRAPAQAPHAGSSKKPRPTQGSASAIQHRTTYCR